jgi:hypothetical protein
VTSLPRGAGSARTLVTLAGQVLVARTAYHRLREAREDGDQLDLADALVNAAALVLGTVVIVRNLRRGEEA